MPYFSERSLSILETCDVRLIRLFMRVVEDFDCTVVHGYRGKELQDELYRTGASQLKFPKSTHNSVPSKGIDVYPCPIDWEDIERMIYFGGFVKGVATKMDIKLVFGGDWNNDTFIKDTKFRDFGHYQTD